MSSVCLKSIGAVKSPYKTPEEAPRQGRERKDTSTLMLKDEKAVDRVRGKRRLRIIYWMHKAGRKVLWSEKRKRGIFATRSPERPNPLGVAVVEVLSTGENELLVKSLDAIDGTPILKLLPLPE
jgi:formylmethanofuran dehydrogenase subunit E